MGVKLRWKSEDFDTYVEVAPIGDKKEHAAGDECWCSPVTERVGRPLIHHNVWDNCYSYNKTTGELPEIILKAPKWSQRDTICVDNCIADVVQHLWDNGIVTQGSCCGHGKTNPSLILGENENNYEYAQTLIAQKDSRSWTLKQWKLVDVSLDEAPPTPKENNEVDK